MPGSPETATRGHRGRARDRAARAARPDRTKPRLRLVLTRGTWVLGTRSARPKVTVALGEPARVRFVLERARGKRWVKLRERSAALPAGASTLSVPGSSRMRPGRHRLRAVVKDAAGNRSRGDCATFVVKPRPRR